MLNSLCIFGESGIRSLCAFCPPGIALGRKPEAFARNIFEAARLAVAGRARYHTPRARGKLSSFNATEPGQRGLTNPLNLYKITFDLHYYAEDDS